MSSTVENWLSRVQPATRRGYLSRLNAFLKWNKENGGKFKDYTPDMLIEYQKTADNGSRYDILDLIQRHILEINGRLSAKKTNYATLKSFFMHNRAEIPKDPSFSLRGDKPKVTGKLSVENIRDMVYASSRLYKAVYTCMFQGGMDSESLVYWSDNGWEDLQSQLKDDPEVVKVQLPGRKKRKNEDPFHTLIGPDSINMLRDWIKKRPLGAKTIFTNQYGEPLTKRSITQNWLRHLNKMGFIDLEAKGRTKATRYGFNLHELRDNFRSQWEMSPAKGSVAEFLMGHVVDPLEYNKAHRDEKWVKSEYVKALPMLQIMSSARPFGQVKEDRVKELETQLEEYKRRFEAIQAEKVKTEDTMAKILRALDKQGIKIE